MYPVYPLLCLLAGVAWVQLSNILLSLFQFIIFKLFPKKVSEKLSGNVSENKYFNKNVSEIKYFKMFLRVGIISFSLCLGLSRIVSNYKNFHGHRHLFLLYIYISK